MKETNKDVKKWREIPFSWIRELSTVKMSSLLRVICRCNNSYQRVIVDIDWQKIFANHVPHKGLVSRVYKEPSKLNNKNMSN